MTFCSGGPGTVEIVNASRSTYICAMLESVKIILDVPRDRLHEIVALGLPMRRSREDQLSRRMRELREALVAVNRAASDEESRGAGTLAIESDL
jgi:hypothetical protein